MDTSTIYLLIVVLIIFLLQESDAVSCYVCSFSPDDKNNRTDICTEGNFHSQRVYVHHDCPLGCEAFIQYDANDVLEHWRRNCVREEQPVTGDCQVNKVLAWKQIRCTCNWDLCNLATVQQRPWSSLLLFGVFLFHTTLLRPLFCT